MPIATEWTAAHLRAHAQKAVELELFTIPAYLCAYYSIDQTRSKDAEGAADALLAIVNQEMMHLEQVCNLANALGRPPILTGAAAPRFPGRVPYNSHNVEITLGPATKAQIQRFMKLELPTWHDPYDAPDLPPLEKYETIGEFYHSLMHGLRVVYGDGGEPWPEGVNEQVYDNFVDDGFPITDLDSAEKALELVIRQGEGGSASDPTTNDPRELAHYYLLQSILDATQGGMHPMVDGVKGLSYSTRCGALVDFFDACYSDLLRRLEASFHGQLPIGHAVGLMHAAVNVLAFHVVEVDYVAKDGGPPTNKTLGPRFRYTTTALQEAFDRLDVADKESEAVQKVAAALKLGGG
jgi:hypothetical protein